MSALRFVLLWFEKSRSFLLAFIFLGCLFSLSSLSSFSLLSLDQIEEIISDVLSSLESTDSLAGEFDSFLLLDSDTSLDHFNHLLLEWSYAANFLHDFTDCLNTGV